MMKSQLIAIALAAMTTVAANAAPETYPTRPIRLVIPYPPGGVVDAIGRPWADRMKALLGTVVVENIGGGGGGLGAAAVARARADGYTILLANSSLLVINPLVSRVPYDPLESFDAVTIIGHVAQAIAVHPALPVHSLQELAEYAKRNRARLSYGTPGVGSLNHLTGERFRLLTGSADIVHVPYRGAGPAIADLIGGQISMAIPAVNGQLLAFHRAGQLRILAVTSPERLRGAPELPTVREAGMPELFAQATTWLLVPKRTPRDIIDRISSATMTALAEPELRQAYLGSGIEPSPDSSPETATQLLRDEIVRWKPIVKQIGLNSD